MQFLIAFVTVAVAAAVASAANVNVDRDLERRIPDAYNGNVEHELERRITDPGNPANLINCPPGGGADKCTLEKPCSRIRLNYGSRQSGHYIWYNYDISDIPTGIEVGEEDSCTDY